MNELKSAIEAILFAAGESVPVARISLVLGSDEASVELCAKELQEEYLNQGRGKVAPKVGAEDADCW